jgi:hypothetical protein
MGWGGARGRRFRFYVVRGTFDVWERGWLDQRSKIKTTDQK